MATTQENKTFVLWFTGLSGSGKSTLADRVYDELATNGSRIEKLDGDVLRGIFPATGFTKDDRNEHIRRVGFLASMLEKHGVIVIASFISPYKEARDFVRQQCGNFIEVYVSTSLDECRRRDVKGLYKRADAGEIKNFTGIDDPYEAPENAEIVVDTEGLSIDESVAVIVNALKDLK
ncbi:MAG: adenylyl-sulfate kinase [Planctomycetes bacterium]|nr:adenylyl-sulfate kinase [Planctomycetota bacterium]